jgi:organic radical activating enzyme
MEVKINKQSGKWFSRGAWITLTINTSCNLRCKDCPLWIGNEEFPQWKQYGIDDWKNFVSKFPEWVSLYSICGGEPSLVKWLAEFVNWLLERGHHVAIYSNLFNVDELLKMKKSKRITIHATYHHQDDKKEFIKAYNLLKDKYRVTVYEFEHPMQLPFSINKDFYKPEDIMNLTSFHCAPNAPMKKTIYLGAEDKYEINSNA